MIFTLHGAIKSHPTPLPSSTPIPKKTKKKEDLHQNYEKGSLLKQLPACYESSMATSSFTQCSNAQVNFLFTIEFLGNTTTIFSTNKRSMSLVTKWNPWAGRKLSFDLRCKFSFNKSYFDPKVSKRINFALCSQNINVDNLKMTLSINNSMGKITMFWNFRGFWTQKKKTSPKQKFRGQTRTWTL